MKGNLQVESAAFIMFITLFINVNGLEKTIMQGMVAGKRSRGKPRQRWEKDITDTFGTMTAASRVAEDRQQFRSDIWAATSQRGYAPRRRNGSICRTIQVTLL